MHSILVVDDLEMNRILIRKNLSALPDIDFLEAADGRQALDILQRKEVDLVLLDLVMPVMDGYAVLEMMRRDERMRHIPVVVQSLLDDDASIIKALELGAYDYFVRTPAGNVFRRDLMLKSRNAIAAYAAFKAAEQELQERKQAEQRLALSRRRGQLADLFGGLMTGRTAYPQFFRQLSFQSIEITFPLRVYLLSVTSYAGRAKRELLERPAEWQSIEDSLLDLLEKCGIRSVWAMEDCIVVLGSSLEPQTMMSRWQSRLLDELPQISLAMSASDPCGKAADLATTYRHAGEALRSAIRVGNNAGMEVYEQIGVDQLLAPLADRQDSVQYVTRALAPLLDYDREHGGDLTRTLEVLLFAADFNEAAEQLNIHLKTLQFRRKRIQVILGLNPADIESRLYLATALRLRRLRGEMGQ